MDPEFRPVTPEDIPSLLEIEHACFTTDRLSKRAFKYWVKHTRCVFWVVSINQQVVGYVLVMLVRGTRLARLYSIAVDKSHRGRHLAERLLTIAEEKVSEKGQLYMRLEVATNNRTAIALYEKWGYKSFGILRDYYEDHMDAVRMQKCVRKQDVKSQIATQYSTPWYQQTTDFTCGPAALMMAMAGLDKKVLPNQTLELELWRQATTIFMTSGHGGCHPIGLALAAKRMGFNAEVILNTSEPLFVDGVRNIEKKQIISIVDADFRKQAKLAGVKVLRQALQQQHIDCWLKRQFAVLVLISTNRLNGKKAPHWVAVTSVDEQCIYFHDPDIDDGEQDALDCQHVPIAREDFEKMATFGSGKLRTAVAITRNNPSTTT